MRRRYKALSYWTREDYREIFGNRHLWIAEVKIGYLVMEVQGRSRDQTSIDARNRNVLMPIPQVKRTSILKIDCFHWSHLSD